jgi:hypothetical protein
MGGSTQLSSLEFVQLWKLIRIFAQNYKYECIELGNYDKLGFQFSPEKLGHFESKGWSFSLLKRAIFSNSAHSQVRPISRGL